MRKELLKCVATVLLVGAFKVMPNCEFKLRLALLLEEDIADLDERN